MPTPLPALTAAPPRRTTPRTAVAGVAAVALGLLLALATLGPIVAIAVAVAQIGLIIVVAGPTASQRRLHDRVARLPDRAKAVRRLQEVLDSRGIVATVLVDLRGFNRVQDLYGQAIADRMLHEAAARLQAAVRATDTVTRFGPNRFAIVMPAAGESQGCAVAERVAAVIRAPFTYGKVVVRLAVSVGLVVARNGECDAETMLRRADLAADEAARRPDGALSLRVFEPAIEQRARDELQLEIDLRGALDAERFVVNYQPIIDLRTSRVACVEALVRWPDPDRGFVTAADFIPAAEATGLIVPLGRWVLQESLRQAAEWRDGAEAGVSVCVNLSVRQLEDESLVAAVGEALARNNLEPAMLVLEVTESALLAGEAPLRRLEELSALGVRLALDDFGTGYSALNLLSRVPVDIVKIDKSITIDLDEPQRAALTGGILQMLHGVGLSTVVEGIETEAQARDLVRMGATLGQGYLLSRPVPPEALVARDGRLELA